MDSFDWNDLRYFIELVRTNSHSAAGKRLKADHTTVRRRVAALEDALQARLFTTREQPLELTSAGEEMLRYAEQIESLTLQASEKVMRTDVQVSGVVRIGAPDGFGSSFLAPRLRPLLDEHPELDIELVAIPRVFNLSKREADIAIALSPPVQNRQIVRKLTSTRLSLYATTSYLESHPIRSLSDLVDHRLVTYIPDLLYAPELDYPTFLGVPIGSTFETTSLIAQLNAALAGLGIAILPHYLTAGEERLHRVLADEFSLEREFWLSVHPDLSQLARVRTVINFIVNQVQHNRALFLGEE